MSKFEDGYAESAGAPGWPLAVGLKLSAPFLLAWMGTCDVSVGLTGNVSEHAGFCEQQVFAAGGGVESIDFSCCPDGQCLYVPK